MLQEIIHNVGFESTHNGGASFLDIEFNTEGYITLVMDYNDGRGFDIEEKEWDQINKRVKQLFKQIKN